MKLITKDRVQRLTDGFLGMLYPHTCPLCGKVTNEPACPKCYRKLIYIREPRCKRCGKPISREQAEYCYDCSNKRHYYDQGFALWLHQEPVQNSIYQFKYHNHRIYSRFYVKELINNYGPAVCRWEIDLIMPIPLYKKKRKQRGYNQAQLIAEQLGGFLSVPVDSQSLCRIHNTSPQKTLGVKSRRQNLKNAFALKGNCVLPERILLIDDIYTTGSTIDAAALVLKRAGAQKVYFLTISIGQGN